jgi:hypothetical protein
MPGRAGWTWTIQRPSRRGWRAWEPSWPHLGEMAVPGVHLAEQVIEPARFLERLAAHGLVPTIELETMEPLRGVARAEAARSRA